MPGRLRAHGISGCLSFLTARSAASGFSARKSKTLENISFRQTSVGLTRDSRPAQSAALEGSAHANFCVTSPPQEADAFEKADALNPPCATSPGSGGFPFKRYKGREPRAPTPAERPSLPHPPHKIMAEQALASYPHRQEVLSCPFRPVCRPHCFPPRR